MAYISLVVIGLLSCVWIAWEDLKSRYIHILPFLLLGISGAIYLYLSFPKEWYIYLLLNLGGVGILMLLLGLIYRWKGEKNILDNKLGLGDIFMFGSLACWFMPKSFWSFFSLNMCVWAGVYGLLQITQFLPKNYPIPLAGLLAIGFMVYQLGLMLLV
ncbi:MAG: hypothetical protein AAF655_17770 [Bacteroidota bacterium]